MDEETELTLKIHIDRKKYAWSLHRNGISEPIKYSVPIFSTEAAATAAGLQVLARMMGGKLRPVRPEVVRTACRMMRDDAPKYAGAHFSALKRILDREEPGYSR